jgi:hypothetical protein
MHGTQLQQASHTSSFLLLTFGGGLAASASVAEACALHCIDERKGTCDVHARQGENAIAAVGALDSRAMPLNLFIIVALLKHGIIFLEGRACRLLRMMQGTCAL